MNTITIKITPGPWRAIHEPVHNIADVQDNGGYRIDADGVEQLAFVWALNRRIPADGGPQENGPAFGAVQAGANARLIAAAPDALEFAQFYDSYMTEQFSQGLQPAYNCGLLNPKAAEVWRRCKTFVAKVTLSQEKTNDPA